MHWSDLPREALLDRRIGDLGVTIEGSPLAPRLAALDRELEARGLRFRPYTWLSTEWFAPDGATGFAIPFFLAHPRLVRLERSQMLEVEGGSAAECMKLLRHETAHAIDNAYGLRRRRRFREVFGRPGAPYRASYSPDPTSRDYVLHLDYWYSQSHPLEDFAETFAVWLAPGSRWRKRYEGWPALEKLQYVDGLMAEIRDAPPKLRTRRREEPAHGVRRTLRAYYARKKAHYADEATPAFDGQLERTFALPADAPPRAPRLAPFLREHRRELVARVARSTGQHRYLLDHVVREMIARAKSRELRLASGRASSLLDAAVVLTSLTGHFLYGGSPRYHR